MHLFPRGHRSPLFVPSGEEVKLTRVTQVDGLMACSPRRREAPRPEHALTESGYEYNELWKQRKQRKLPQNILEA